jgi:GT2 family glycosyltransferase
MKVCAVIVTYGERFHLLKQVMDACYKEGVSKIIVVDNNSSKNSKIELKKYENEHKDRLKVIYLNENTGSAGGYKRGLQEAYNDSECEFIWLLDDDNMPQKDSLKVLENFWNDLNQEDKNEKVALLSYRPDRQRYKISMQNNNPIMLLGIDNTFMDFHIKYLFSKIFRHLNLKLKKTLQEKIIDNIDDDIDTGTIPLAPYGGMYFHKNLINTIGYPDEKFFVYADDHEWSYRITINNGKILLILKSELEDLEKSWNLDSSTNRPFNKFLYLGSDFQAYYATRNNLIFERRKITSSLVYNINKVIYMTMMRIFVNKTNIERYKIIKKAINDSIK